MPISEQSTETIVAELISRDGVEYESIKAGQEVNYKPTKDVLFIVVPPDAKPHKKTTAEIRDGIKTELMAYLLTDYKTGDQEAGKLLVELLKG